MITKSQVQKQPFFKESVKAHWFNLKILTMQGDLKKYTEIANLNDRFKW